MLSNVTRIFGLLVVGALIWTAAAQGKEDFLASLNNPAAARADKAYNGNGRHNGWELSVTKAVALKVTPTPTATATPKPTATPTPKPTATPAPKSVTRGELAGADRCAGADDLTRPRAATLCLVNYARTYNGRAKLASLDQLNSSSLQKAHDVADCGYNHNPCDRANPLPSGVGCVGEVLYQGVNTPRQAVKGWLASSGHRALLLGRDYTKFGAATLSDNGGRIWVVQVACHE